MNKNKRNRALIISGGTLTCDTVEEELKKGGFLIGVDSGINYLYQHKIDPDFLVGDFDSVDSIAISHYKSKGQIPIREFNPVKDASDTEIAVRLAMELGFQEITILGATGSRIDHVLANIQVLTIPYRAGIHVNIVDSINRISLVSKNAIYKKCDLYGPYFSLFALGGTVKGLTLKGSKYPLENHELLPYDSLSISNQVIEEELEIRYEEGILILIEAKEA